MTDRSKTDIAIAALVEAVPDPRRGLPDNVFYYISKTTPLVNVDLLVKDDLGRTLLAWRDDPLAGRGWHVPGGIIRFKETFSARIEKVAQTELGTSIQYDPVPIAVHEIIHPERDTRGHFISLLFKCFLPSTFIPENEGLSVGDRGYLTWHDRCPEDLLPVHELYRDYIDTSAVQKGRFIL